MYRYNEFDFNTKTLTDLEKVRSHSIISAIANDVFLDTRKYQKKKK